MMNLNCIFTLWLFDIKNVLNEVLLQISYDIVEDILVQGDRLRDVLQQLQDAVHLTKVRSFLHLWSHVCAHNFYIPPINECTLIELHIILPLPLYIFETLCTLLYLIIFLHWIFDNKGCKDGIWHVNVIYNWLAYREIVAT